MKIWIDDTRPAPDGFVWCKKTDEVVLILSRHTQNKTYRDISLISLDHDAGDYARFGGDYVKVLDWLEFRERMANIKVNFPIHLHTRNPIGHENMRRIIDHNSWEYQDELEPFKFPEAKEGEVI